jgi:hypothetical protein
MMVEEDERCGGLSGRWRRNPRMDPKPVSVVERKQTCKQKEK